MKILTTGTLMLLIKVLFFDCFAQDPVNIVNNKNLDYFEKKKQVEEKLKNKTLKHTESFQKKYSRYTWFWDTRIDAQGGYSTYMHELKNALKSTQQMSTSLKSSGTGTWNCIGPLERPEGGTPRGIGRMESVWVDDDDPRHILAGACTGGLWETGNGGATWNCITDNDGDYYGGVEYIEVDPNYPGDNVIYITSSVYQNGLLAEYKYGMGIFKTTDGGDNWTELSDGIEPGDEMYLRCVRVKPGDSNYVFACGKNKIYRSTNAGTSWSVRRTGHSKVNYKQMEFHPTNPSVMYVAGYHTDSAHLNHGEILVSENSGNTFSSIKSGGLYGVALAVHPDSADRMYALYSPGQPIRENFVFARWKKYEGWKTYDTILNMGRNSFMSSMIELHINDDWDILGSCVDLYRYDHGTQEFHQITGGSGTNYLHADIRQICSYTNSTGYDTVFIACDGGISKITNLTYSTSTTFEDLTETGGLAANQVYGVALTDMDPDIVFGGTHDCGFIYQNGDGWKNFSSEGGSPEIDYTDPFIWYYVNNYGSEGEAFTLWKRTWTSPTASNFTDINGVGAFNAMFYIHPTNPNILYTSQWIEGEPTGTENKLLRSTNKGDDSFPNWDDEVDRFIFDMDLYDEKADTGFYTSFGWGDAKFRYTTNGSTWNNLGMTNLENFVDDYPVTAVEIIKVNETTHKDIICFAGFNAGKKVYYTTNFSGTWTNNSTNLPNLPVNCLTEDQLTGDLYVGTDVGVYKLGASGWDLFGSGLPRAMVTEIGINNTTREMVVSTYGRGFWKIPLDNNIVIPDLIIDGNNFSSENTIHWSDNFTCFRNIVLRNDAILEINGAVTLDDGKNIVVEDGGALVIDDGGRLNVQNGGEVIIEDNGTFVLGDTDTISLSGSGKLSVHDDGFVCIHSSGKIILEACNSTMDFYVGYQTGVNTSVMTLPFTPVTNLSTLSSSGSGIFRGEDSSPETVSGTISNTQSRTKDIIYAGTDLGSSPAPVVTSSGDLTLTGELLIQLGNNFSANAGSELEISITNPCD